MYKGALLKSLRSLRKFGLLTEVSELDELHHVSSERPALIDCSIFELHTESATAFREVYKMELVKRSVK